MYMQTESSTQKKFSNKKRLLKNENVFINRQMNEKNYMVFSLWVIIDSVFEVHPSNN